MIMQTIATAFTQCVRRTTNGCTTWPVMPTRCAAAFAAASSWRSHRRDETVLADADADGRHGAVRCAGAVDDYVGARGQRRSIRRLIGHDRHIVGYHDALLATLVGDGDGAAAGGDHAADRAVRHAATGGAI